jgi:hypothetical protein
MSSIDGVLTSRIVTLGVKAPCRANARHLLPSDNCTHSPAPGFLFVGERNNIYAPRDTVKIGVRRTLLSRIQTYSAYFRSRAAQLFDADRGSA